MKIIYSGLKYTNLNPNLGLSFEHNNFYESLRKLPGVELIYFPYDYILELGKEKWNSELLNLIKAQKPDVFFAFMFTDEFNPDILEEIKKITTSVVWFSDDHWRFENYSRYYVPHFFWAITTYSKAVEKYKKIGINNVIRSQWAANTDIYKKIESNDSFRDVTFVGTWSRPRQKIISALERAGVKVNAYGSGWKQGRVNKDKMLEIFSNSKINLALNPAPSLFNVNSLARLFFKRSRNKFVPDFHLWNNLKSWFNRRIPQIKARHFEIPACGGFVISSLADDIENYFEPNKEMVFYKNLDDLIGKIKYYLEHNEERRKIAESSYQRVIKHHTYEKRFSEIFQKIKGA